METDHEHPLLEVRDLVVAAPDAQAENLVDRLSFSVGSGEILGIAGVEGNGQHELVETVTGLREPDSGKILLGGEDMTATDASTRRRRGLSVIPEDRHGLGLVLDMSLAENLTLSDIPAGRYDSRGLLQWNLIRRRARQLLEEYDVRPPNPSLKAASLSGGNQQKVCLGRALCLEPKVLFVSEPTRGIDIGAKQIVIDWLRQLNREQGITIVMTSSELAELRSICQRIAIVCEGKLAGILASDAPDVRFGLLMSGEAA